jgi:hypothetical protein
MIFRAAGIVVGATAIAFGATPTAGASADMSTPTAHDTTVGTAPSDDAVPATYSNCALQDFCAWSSQNGTGTKKAWYKCQTVGRPFDTRYGSYYNHQTDGANTVFYYTDGTHASIPPRWYGNIDWTLVTSIRIC